MVSKIAAKLTKIGGGQPTPHAMFKFFARVDADPQWYPGKSYQQSRGPGHALSAQAMHILAEGAMRIKKQKLEPTHSEMVTRYPRAIINPYTQKPLCKDGLYKLLRGTVL